MRLGKLLIVGLVLSTAGGCIRKPDVVVRRGTAFTKESSLSLSVRGGDQAIFRPELEKELMRRGFNIVTDDISQVVEKESRFGGEDLAAAVESKAGSSKAAAGSKAEEVTTKQTSKVVSSEFVGRIEYIYRQDSHTVNRLNFTIFHLKTGSVVASIGFEKKGSNPTMARAIAEQLDSAMTGVPIKKSPISFLN